MLVERVREGGTDPAMPLGVRAWPGRPAASCCSLRSAALTSLSQFSRDLAMAPPTGGGKGGDGGRRPEAGIPRPRARVLLLRSDADRVGSGRNPSTAEGADLEASSGTVEKRSRKEGEREGFEILKNRKEVFSAEKHERKRRNAEVAGRARRRGGAPQLRIRPRLGNAFGGDGVSVRFVVSFVLLVDERLRALS